MLDHILDKIIYLGHWPFTPSLIDNNIPIDTFCGSDGEGTLASVGFLCKFSWLPYVLVRNIPYGRLALRQNTVEATEVNTFCVFS